MPFLALHRRKSESFSKLIIKKSVSPVEDHAEKRHAAEETSATSKRGYRRRKWRIMNRLTGRSEKVPLDDAINFCEDVSIDGSHYGGDLSSGFGTMSTDDAETAIISKRKRLLRLLKPSRHADRKRYSTFRDNDGYREASDDDDVDFMGFSSCPGMKMKRNASKRKKDKRKNSDAVSESNMSNNADPGVNSDSDEDEAFKDEIAVSIFSFLFS